MKLQALDVIAGERRWSCDCMDALRWAKKLPSNSVHLIATSPPYYALRDYQVEGQIGMEKTPSLFIKSLVKIFRELRRVLRDDGVMFLNIGDTYQVSKGNSGGFDPKQSARRNFKNGRPNDKRLPGLKAKDMIGIPWMLAFALREDGWFLRQEIIWQKPNVMPGSSQDRFCTSHEQIFLMTKKPRYFFDLRATEEAAAWAGTKGGRPGNWAQKGEKRHPFLDQHNRSKPDKSSRKEVCQTRNKRSVWKISTRKFKGAHFAAFPPHLVFPMVRSACSERGCCAKCGSQVIRQVEKQRIPTRPGRDTKLSVDRQTGQQLPLRDKPWAAAEVGNRDPKRHITVYTTIGWKPSCKCDAGLRGCIVLDPFAGTATVGQVALENGHDFIGCELSEEYIKLVDQRMSRVTSSLMPERIS